MKTLLDGLIVLKVRKKSYVLCYSGLKRGQKTYDVLAPDGSQICTGVCQENTLECCQLHYVTHTQPAKRRNKIKVEKAILSIKKLEHGNDAQTDRTNLGDYADYSFDDTDNFNMHQFQKRFS